jgi:hypothetical protein
VAACAAQTKAGQTLGRVEDELRQSRAELGQARAAQASRLAYDTKSERENRLIAERELASVKGHNATLGQALESTKQQLKQVEDEYADASERLAEVLYMRLRGTHVAHLHAFLRSRHYNRPPLLNRCLDRRLLSPPSAAACKPRSTVWRRSTRAPNKRTQPPESPWRTPGRSGTS